MVKGIWKKLVDSVRNGNSPLPITALAPMEDVTDTVFRQIVADIGPPNIFFTEFVNVTGMRMGKGDAVINRLQYSEKERPLIAQIWGNTPDDFLWATDEVVKRRFDGIDINMGCPATKIVKKGSCSALIKTPDLAGEIITAVKGNAGDLPVSVKTRIGFDEVVTQEWCGFLLEQDLDALIVHGRTTAQMSKVPADWDEIGKVVKLREEMGKDTVIMGNGDIKFLSQSKDMMDRYGVDGVMIGRGIFEDPWVFNPDVDGTSISPKDRLDLLYKHLKLWDEVWGNSQSFGPMKKFVKAYIRGFDGAAEVRAQLMVCNDVEGMLEVVNTIVS